MPTDLILGTAGHIDHGKTSLVRALTGVDTDRLPEEKRRGITIDLGFASLSLGDYRLGLVDVPGHERFVRNMLVGATGLDLALLVVAADDSIKPQTIEHLDILRRLNLPAGVIALTKADTVTGEWLALVAEEVRALVAGTFLHAAPLIATSVVSGQGLDELRTALATAAAQAAQARAGLINSPLRMPIDRVFHVPGHGLVVTGSVQSGSMRVGDEVEIHPGGLRARVRGIQNHDQAVEHVVRGQRAAVNLAGLKAEQLHRGHELAAIGHLRASRTLTVRLHLNDSARALKQRAVCRVHLGASELLGKVRLLAGPRLDPGGVMLAQLLLNQDAVAVWGQPLVIRSESPVITIGGGVVIDPRAPLLRRPTTEERQRLERWQLGKPLERADAALYFAGLDNWQPADLHATAGVSAAESIAAELQAAGTVIEVPLSPVRSLLVHRDVVQRLEQRLQNALERRHDAEPMRSAFPRTTLDALAGSVELALHRHIVARLLRTGVLRQLGDAVGLAHRGPQLSQNEQKLLRQLVDWYRQAGFEAPTATEMQARAAKNQAAVPHLLAIAVDNGDLVRITDQYYLAAEVDRQSQQRLIAGWPAGGAATLSQIRELLETSRKYAVPYGEYLDRIGFTVRRGDLRHLAAAAQRATRPHGP